MFQVVSTLLGHLPYLISSEPILVLLYSFHLGLRYDSSHCTTNTWKDKKKRRSHRDLRVRTRKLSAHATAEALWLWQLIGGLILLHRPEPQVLLLGHQRGLKYKVLVVPKRCSITNSSSGMDNRCQTNLLDAHRQEGHLGYPGALVSCSGKARQLQI